jgi:hypothetical protein
MLREEYMRLKTECLGEYLGLTKSNGRQQTVAQGGASKPLLSAKYY